MSRTVKSFGTVLLVLMTLSSAFLPLAALAAGNSSNTFSDGTTQKDVTIPAGGGDNTGTYLTLLPNETVKNLDLTVTPKATIINKSIVLPLDEGLQSGTYSDKYLSVDNAGLSAKLYSFTHLDYLSDTKGIDLSNTTANWLVNEGLTGMALGTNKTANLTTVLESAHVVWLSKSFNWGGRLIKNLTLNASGNANIEITATVKAWNSQTMQWDVLYNNQHMAASLNHFTLVQQNYAVPIYSQLTITMSAQAAGTIWFNMNVTYEGFNKSSVVTSVPIGPVTRFNWSPDWTVYDCNLDAVRDLPSKTHINISLSPDNGTTWENAVVGADHTFAKPGTVLRWRADLSADIANITPVLRFVSLACHRNTDPGDYSWHSREYHISEGAFVSYSVSWEGTVPSGTAVSAYAQRGSLDPTVHLGNGVTASFNYNASLQNLSFSLFVSPWIDKTPTIMKLVLNYTVSLMPSDIAIDVGNDGTIEWSMKGVLGTDHKINGTDAKGLVAALNSKAPRTGGQVDVPIRVLSSARGSVSLHDLKVEYGLPPELKTRISVISLNEDNNKTGVLSLDDYFTDDYDPLHLTYSVSYLEDPTKVLATVRGPMLDISLPTLYWNGPSMIRVMATDKDNTSTESNDITVMVWPVDEPPVITYVPSDVPAFVGAAFLGQVKAFDPEGRNLTYRLDVGLPDVSMNRSTGLISWRPVTTQRQKIVVNVSDGTNYVLSKFNLTPTVDLTKASPPVFVTLPFTEARVDESYSYYAHAVDLDNDPLEYQLVRAPSGMTVDTSQGLVDWSPKSSQLGYQNVSLRVSDGAFFSEQDFKVLVLNSAGQNRPPVISSTPPSSVWVGRPYIYRVKATDPDPGTALSYKLVKGPAGMSFDDGGLVLWVPTATDLGAQGAQVQVSDGVTQVSQIWTITVYSTDRTCVISAPAPSEVVKDKIVIKGLASGPNNLTRVEVRLGDDVTWKTADGTSKWRYELNTSSLSTGYYTVSARACDDMTCSGEASVRFYHQGSGSAVSSGPSPYWYAVILVIIIIVVLLLVDLKAKFIKGPQDKKDLEDEEQDLYSKDRLVYHKKDR